MPIHFDGPVAVFTEIVSVDDAEPLLEWLSGQPARTVDLAACSHLHTAIVQVLLAAHARVLAWPRNPTVTQWLQTALPRSSASPDTPAISRGPN